MSIFFDSWQGLIRAVVAGVLAYVWLIAFIRISGKRTLSKLNAFDLIVTVALGSTLANVLLSEDVSILEGIVGLSLLVALQFAVAWLSVRFSIVSRMVKSNPRLLFYRGEYQWEVMRRERVVESEILQSIRAQGIASLGDVEAVVLETDGTLAVVKRSDEITESSLRDVGHPEE